MSQFLSRGASSTRAHFRYTHPARENEDEKSRVTNRVINPETTIWSARKYLHIGLHIFEFDRSRWRAKGVEKEMKREGGGGSKLRDEKFVLSPEFFGALRSLSFKAADGWGLAALGMEYSQWRKRGAPKLNKKRAAKGAVTWTVCRLGTDARGAFKKAGFFSRFHGGKKQRRGSRPSRAGQRRSRDRGTEPGRAPPFAPTTAALTHRRQLGRAAAASSSQSRAHLMNGAIPRESSELSRVK